MWYFIYREVYRNVSDIIQLLEYPILPDVLLVHHKKYDRFFSDAVHIFGWSMICPKQITDNFSNTKIKIKNENTYTRRAYSGGSRSGGLGSRVWFQLSRDQVGPLLPWIRCCLLHLSPSKQCITICWFGVDRMYGGHLVPHRPPSIQPLFDAANFTQLFSLQTRSK